MYKKAVSKSRSHSLCPGVHQRVCMFTTMTGVCIPRSECVSFTLSHTNLTCFGEICNLCTESMAVSMPEKLLVLFGKNACSGVKLP